MTNDALNAAPDRQPDELALFLSAARPLNSLSSDQSKKIKARALETLLGNRSPAFKWRWSMALAALGLVMFGGAMAAAAARYGLLPWVRVERTQAEDETKRSANRTPSRIREREPEAVETAVAPAPAVLARQTDEPSEPRGEPSRTPSAHGRRAPHSLAFTSPSQLAKKATAEPTAERPAKVTEQSVLSEALRRLRQEKDAAGALVLLDKLETDHPRSLFALERSNMQVEALLALGREEEALSRLDGVALEDLPRSTERYLLRGELRARFQRWAEARDDFEHALSKGSGPSTWHERALWGRGLARMGAGDRVGGETDLKRYLATYPSGRHAAEAERMLAPRR